MAAKKPKELKEDTLEKNDINLFEVIAAIDNKDYGYYDKLTDEQKKKIVPHMLIQWISALQGNKDLQASYLKRVEYHANKHFYNYMIASKEHDNTKLQWLMLCAASPRAGKVYHKYIPKISERVSLLKENATVSDIKKYYQKIYPNANENAIDEVSKEFVFQQKKKVVLGKIYPALKIDEIELLSTIVTDDDIKQYERDSGN
jgi:hypothetical protein